MISISYNARYTKLREVKKAHFPDFWRSSLGWRIFGLGSTVLHILHFLSYFIYLTLTDASCVMRYCIGSFVIHFIPGSICVLAL